MGKDKHSSPGPCSGCPVDLEALGPGGSKCLAADQLGDHDDDYAYVYEASGAGGPDDVDVVTSALVAAGETVEQIGNICAGPTAL